MITIFELAEETRLQSATRARNRAAILSEVYFFSRRLPYVLMATLAFGFLAGCKQGADQQEKITTEVAVQVGKLVRTNLHAYVIAYGTVESEPAHDGKEAASARLAPAAPGVVAEVMCSEGQRVEKGAALFRLDSRPLDVAIEFGTQTVERQKKLLAAGGTSQKAVQEAEQQLAAAQAQKSLLVIQAPFAGVITRMNARAGEAVDLTSVLGELTDPNRSVATVSVPASESNGLKSGQPAEFIADGTRVGARGAVLFVSPQVDPKTGAALVRVTVPPKAGLRPGQYLQVRIISEDLQDRLAAPVESVVKTEEGESVIAVVDGDKAVQKPVKAGLRDGGLVEIEGEGLKEGQRVVTIGAYGLPKETKIKVINEKEKN